MRTIEVAETDVVEAEVVLFSETLGPLAIFPNPIAKAILQLLLLLPRGNSFRLIYGATSILVLVVSRWRPAIQRLLDKFGCAEACGAVGCSVIDHVLCAVIEFDRPRGDSFGAPDLHTCAGYIQQSAYEFADI